MTLTEFLLARIAEDEQLAAYILDGGHWRGIGVDSATQVATHITRHRPDRVLAACEAKRRIVERCDLVPAGATWEHEGLMDDVLRLLASEYADHPDYRDEWRP